MIIVIKCVMLVVFLFSLKICILLSDAAETNNTVYSQDNPSLSPQNGIVCTESHPYVWCLPLNYKKEAAPWEYRYLTYSPIPWNYHFDFYIFDIHEINEKSQTLKISMYFELTWHEPRLRTNKSANTWRAKNYVPTSILNSNYLWHPDLEIYGVQTSPRQLFMKDLSGILITKQQQILYSLRLDITLSCQMDFNRYPFDSQTCPFRVSSYFEDDKIVRCTSELHNDYLDEFARTLQYKIKIEELPQKYRTLEYQDRDYSRCGFMILYTRSKTQLIFQVYVTSGMLVIMSWTSFLINPHIVPGRMGLLVTLFLVLVNIFNGFKNSSPPSISLNALDVFLIICIGHVFCVLIQYSIVLLLGNFHINISLVSCHKVCDQNHLQKAKSTKKQICGDAQQHRLMNTLDSTSLIAFPIFFILCLIVYGAIYAKS